MAPRTKSRSTDTLTARQNRALVALHALGLELGAQLDMKKLLRQIVEEAVELLDADGGSICLYNEVTGLLDVVESAGDSESAIGRTLKPGAGLAGRVFVTGKPTMIEDYFTWEGRIPEFVTVPGECVVIVPLRWRDQVIGTLGFQTAGKGRTFDQDEIWLAELFAAQAAVAIGNTRLYEAERTAHLRLEAVLDATQALSSSLDLPEVLDSILSSCKLVLPYRTASIMVFEGGVPTMAALAGYQGQEERIIRQTKSDLKISRIIDRMMKDLQPLIIPDVREHPDWITLPGGGHIRGWLGLPLVSRQELIGVLMLDSDQVGAYTLEHVQTGQMLAAQAAIALEKAHLFSAMERALTQIEAYFKASEAIVSASDPYTLLRVIAGPALAAGPCKAYLLYVERRAEGPPRWVELAAGLRNPPAEGSTVGSRFSIQDFSFGRVLMEQPHRIQIIPDVEARADLLDDRTRDLLKPFNVRSLAIIPLIVGSRWIGVVALVWSEPHHVRVQEEQFYAVIAPHVAAVIDNLRLLEESGKAQERFHDMALSTSDWLWETDPQGRITYCSERVADVAGYHPEEIIGQTPFDFMAPRDARRFRVAVARLGAAPQPISEQEQWVHHKDGHPLCMAISAVPILDADGNFLGYRGVSKDVTEQRRAEQRDRLAYELGHRLTAVLSLDDICKTIVDQLLSTFGYYHVSIWLYDQQQNALVIRNTYGAETVSDQGVFSYDLNARPSLVARAGRTRQVVVSNDTRRDPDFNRTLALPDTRAEVVLPLMHGEQLLGALNVESAEIDHFNPAEVRMLQNLSAQTSIAMANALLYQQLEQQAAHLEELVRERTGDVLRERERLQSIVEHAGEGIIFTRADGLIEYINPSWELITGVHHDRVVGQRLADMVGEEVLKGLNQMLGAFRPGDSWEGELRLRRPDGSEVDAGLRIVPVPDAKGRISNMVGVLRDITARKQVDRMRSKFVANVSHELRTPITNLKLYHTLISGASGDKLAEYLATMGDQVSRLEKLVEDLLDVSRLDRGQLEIQPELADLNRLLNESVDAHRLSAERRGLNLSVTLLPDLPPVYIDRRRMAQVAVNLLTNAINYTPQGESVGLRSWREQRDSTEWVAFSVWDTGMGVSPEDLPFIFEAFFRSEEAKQSGMPGTGLGLSIVKEIVEMHHGSVSVESGVRKGTTFTVLLPAYASADTP